MDGIEEKLRAFIAENLLFSGNGYPYSDETSFLDNGIVDSMNIMEIVLFSEKAFGVTIRDQEIVRANFDSVANLAKFLRAKLSDGQPAGGRN